MSAPYTRRERIATLEKRLAYLVTKRDRCKRAGKPFSYFTDEIEALRWALPILRAEVEPRSSRSSPSGGPRCAHCGYTAGVDPTRGWCSVCGR